MNDRRMDGGSLIGLDGQPVSRPDGETVGQLLEGSSEQDDNGTPVQVWRWPHSASWSARELALSELIRQERPDVVSVQFVPYSFHPKGLPFGFVWMIRRVANAVNVKWQAMFHELWVGEESGAKPAHRVLRLIQIRLIKDFLQGVQPNAVWTSNDFYQYLLHSIGHPALLVPLFSNFRFPQFVRNGSSARSQRIAIFGSLESNELGIQLLDAVTHAFGSRDIELRLIGNVGENWLRVVESVGLNSTESGFIGDASCLFDEFQRCSIGLAGSNIFRIGKSGSVRAMLEARLPIVVGDAGWHPRRFSCIPTKLPDGCIGYDDFRNGSRPEFQRAADNNLSLAVKMLCSASSYSIIVS